MLLPLTLAFQHATPLQTPRTSSRLLTCRRRPRAQQSQPPPPNSEREPDKSHTSSLVKNARRAAFIAAAAVTLSTALPELPPPANALGLAPTPINPYARRRRERAYKEYAQQLETTLEKVAMADFKKVVEAGGGGLGVSYRIAGFAAFVASAMSTAVVHPIDSIKTRMQMWGFSNRVFEGVYSGLWSNVLKEAPNAAIYLGVYELIKNGLMNLHVTSFFHDLPLVTFLVAGALGDAVGSVVRVPAEIVNKRLQLGVNEDWKEALGDAFLQKGGREASWVAWTAVLCRDVPYGGLQIMLYEFGKLWMQNHAAMLGDFARGGVLADVMIGAAAGALAAMATTPADVLVTKLSVQHPQSYLETRQYMGVVSTAKRIWNEEGLGGFFKGTWQRGLYYAPMIGLFFALYEMNRMWLQHPNMALSALEPVWEVLKAEWRLLPAQVAGVYSAIMPMLGGLLSLWGERGVLAGLVAARSQM